MQPIEGITPEILWYTLIGIIGIGSVIILGDKVVDVFRRKKERDEQKAKPTEALAAEVSRKVLEKLEPRFAEIDRKLANDKLLIEDHTAKLSVQHRQIDEIEQGNKVMCRGVLAILSHMITGNGEDKLRESQAEITNYLIER